MKYQKVIETNKELMPKGERSGDISYDHQRLEQLDDLRWRTKTIGESGSSYGNASKSIDLR